MAQLPGLYALFPQQSYVVGATTGQTTAYQNLCGQVTEFPDVDVIAGVTTVNSDFMRRVILVQNTSGTTIAAGAALNWVSGNWGTQVQACPVGQIARCFAPGYINGSTANTIPSNAFFYAVYTGPTLALTSGLSISVYDALLVGATAGQVNSARTQFSSISSSAAVTNTTSATAFATNQYTYIANSLLAGDVIRLTGTAPITWNSGTIKFQVLIGTTVVSDTGAYTPATGDIFTFDTAINILTNGASGTLTGNGTYFGPTTAAQKTFTALTSTAVDTTATQLVSVKVTWGTANAGNSVVLSRFQAQKVSAAAGTSAEMAYALADFTGANTASRQRIRVNAQW